MLFALLLSATACAAQSACPLDEPPPTVAATDSAGNRLEPLPPSGPVPDEESDEGRLRTGRYCLDAPRWCVWAEREAPDAPWRMLVWHNRRPDTPLDPAPRRLELDGSEEAMLTVWPWIVREPDGAVLVGMLATWSASFSGGGAAAARLLLYRAEANGRGFGEVLDVPVGASATIRACFFEDDTRQRLEACHDEYGLAGTLNLAPSAGVGGRPVLLLETRARSWPGEAWRWSDNADERPPLQPADLVWSADPVCSFRRSFAVDPATGRYVPDSPLPGCGQYLVAWEQLRGE